jgi:5-methylcytosine-specific restriction endonuclease McrA
MKLSFSSPIFRRLYSAQDGKCFYCNKKMLTNQMTDITRDHLVPLSKRGSKSGKNIVLACFECNSKKADRKPTKEEKDRFKIIRYIFLNMKPIQYNKIIINAHQNNI